MLGQRREASLVIGPIMVVPLDDPFGVSGQAPLSSQNTEVPSFLFQNFLCLTMRHGKIFFLSSGFPCLIEQIKRSPMDAEGSLFRTPDLLLTEKRLRTLAPELSQHGSWAPTGTALVILIPTFAGLSFFPSFFAIAFQCCAKSRNPGLYLGSIKVYLIRKLLELSAWNVVHWQVIHVVSDELQSIILR